MDSIKYVKTETTRWVAAGANDVEYTVEQPGDTTLVDLGLVCVTAVAGVNGNAKIKASTDVDGNDIVALASFVSNNKATLGSSIQIASGAKGEAGASLVFQNAAPLYTAYPRTIFIRLEHSQAITDGGGFVFIGFIK